MIDRKYFKLVENELSKEEITVLLGTRRVGKTTILENLYNSIEDKKKVFLTFDDIEVLSLFENNEKLFKEQYVDQNDIIFIDEIQYSKESGRILKFLFDTTKKKFFISGSSIPDISINSLSYLVGRIRIFNIFPITFEEFVKYKAKNKFFLFDKKREINDFNQLNLEFEEYLKYGSYPKIIISELNDKEKILKDLTNTYLLKEVKEILEYKNIFEFEKFLTHIALIDGKLVNKSSISQELEINRNSISEMIEVLNNTFIIYEVKPYLKNKIKEQIKSSKIYFQDLGFKNSLMKNFSDYEKRLDKGEILENFVLNQLIRNDYEVKFWNYKNRYEIDFVIEKNGEIIGIECKSKLKNDSLTTSTKEFIKEYTPKKVYILNLSLDSVTNFENTSIEFTSYYNLISILNNKLLFQ